MSSTVFDLNQRSVDIFRELVDAYMETGEPVGSRTLSRRLKTPLSPATIRNVMADLEDAGLLYAPHTSAGRMPTAEGLRFFVHGLLEIGDISQLERDEIERRCAASGKNVDRILDEATRALSGLSACAGLVMAPKADTHLKHIEFVKLGSDRGLVVMMLEDGVIENRIIDLPPSITPAMLTNAGVYLSARIAGKTLNEARCLVTEELLHNKTQLDALTSKVVEQGLAMWSGGESDRSLIVKGQSHLLDNVYEFSDLDHIRALFQVLDTQDSLKHLLDAAIEADGVQIFIGAENNLFHLSGCSVVVSPYRDNQQRIVGAIGVIGPSRMNYSRIIPLVDYTAKMVGKLLR
jgi:heat-inducible transcriptional repressor